MKTLISTLILSQLVLACGSSGGKKKSSEDQNDTDSGWEVVDSTGDDDEGTLPVVKPTVPVVKPTVPVNPPVVRPTIPVIGPTTPVTPTTPVVTPTTPSVTPGVTPTVPVITPIAQPAVKLIVSSIVLNTGVDQWLDLSELLKTEFASIPPSSGYEVKAFSPKHNIWFTVKDKKFFVPATFTGHLSIELLHEGLGVKVLKTLIVTKIENIVAATETHKFVIANDVAHRTNDFLEGITSLKDKSLENISLYYELIELISTTETNPSNAVRVLENSSL